MSGKRAKNKTLITFQAKRNLLDQFKQVALYHGETVSELLRGFMESEVKKYQELRSQDSAGFDETMSKSRIRE